MSFIKFLFILLVVLYWSVFCIFNTGSISIYLPGLQRVEIPVSLFVFIVFLFGVFITALLALTDQVHQWSLNRKLRKKINEIEKDESRPHASHEAMTIDRGDH